MARFALFTNGVKVETLDELRENYNINDMLQNFESKALHRWLASNCLFEELTKVEQIKANVSDEVNSVLMDILGVPEKIKQEFLEKKQQEQKQRENAQDYLDSIARLKELSEILQQSSYSEAEIDEFITLPVPVSEFIRELKQIPQLEVIVSKVKTLALTNMPAKVKLGTLYAKGVGVEKNDDLAFIFYEQAAEQGDSYGMNCLASCFRLGKGCEKNQEKYIELVKKSAALQNPVAINNFGVAYRTGSGVEKSYDKANELFIQASKIGYALAYYNLGWSYEHGLGFEKNLAKAVQLYQEAAIKGDPLGQTRLGVCYQFGKGIEKNLEKAVLLYRRAAEQESAEAQYNLGCCYETGTGVTKNLVEAVQWYEKAANQGHARSQFSLGLCYDFGEGVEKDYCKAVELYDQAANNGSIAAKRNLGFMYQYGNGVEKDINKAIELYEEAANNNDNLAMQWLGDIFFELEDNLFDIDKALTWYNKAIEKGNKKACLKKFEVFLYNGLDESDYDFLIPEALNTLLDAYNNKVSGAESFICLFKYMQNSLQQDEGFERIIKFFTENCPDFDDSIEAWCSILLSQAANDVKPALLVLGIVIINAEDGGEYLSQLTGAAFDTNDAKDFLKKAANWNYRLAKKVLKDEEDMEL